MPDRRAYADWIDYRHSLAHTWTRRDNHEPETTIKTCTGCGTETDVANIAHSPHCPTITGGHA